MKSCVLLLVVALLLGGVAMFLLRPVEVEPPSPLPTAQDESAAEQLAASEPAVPDHVKKVEALTGLDLVLIPAGTFLMGSLPTEEGHDRDESPQHEVHISQPFWIASTEVTNAHYMRYRDATGIAYPTYWADQKVNGDEQPQVGVTWDEAVAYCDWAGMALPSEAQWEYAARAGTTTRYWSGDSEEDLTRVGWYGFDRLTATSHPVGEKPANAFGLHDVHGNVWEWTADWSRKYSAEPRTDPTGPPEGEFRVLRGGSWAHWHDPSRDARSADRYWFAPSFFGTDVGFRPILAAAPAEPSAPK